MSLLQFNYPNIKLIVILRNPIDRAYSNWNMLRDKFEIDKTRNKNKKGRFPDKRDPIYVHLIENRKSFPSFMEALQIELNLLMTQDIELPAFLRFGLYAKQIKTYYKYFNKKQILILGFNDLIQNTEFVLNKIYKFIGVKNLPIAKIIIKPKNSRSYKTEMSTKVRQFLKKNIFMNPTMNYLN